MLLGRVTAIGGRSNADDEKEKRYKPAVRKSEMIYSWIYLAQERL